MADKYNLFTESELTKEACAKLIEFYESYQEKNWNLFLSLREEWATLHPELPLSDALCANINTITGEFRPVKEQRIWCWGDGRALGIWGYSLLCDLVPDKTVTLRNGKSVNMKDALKSYCDDILAGSIKRYELNKGTIPVAASPATGLADDHPWNPETGIGIKTFSNLFTVTGWVLYGIYTDNSTIVDKGIKEFDSVLKSFETFTFHTGASMLSPAFRVHGPRMIALGVAGEILKGLDSVEKKGISKWSGIKNDIIVKAIKLLEYILDGNYRQDPISFWERSNPDGTPMTIDGITTVDPGHASEFSGFLAEVIPYLPAEWGSSKWNREKALKAALYCHLFAGRVGFSPKGVMYKAVDLYTEKPLPDGQAIGANGRLTAPWWNVREHCASALRLYTLTRDNRLIESFRKAQHASYTAYPNPIIMDQMIQTIDPETLEPVDIAPATGNLDPMHDPRARIREIENLKILLS
ncbi:MAG: hypothetical protein JNL74_08990 [Fibrobacteres bacterium]|nr:hypothetical protein [Fibrobacterota bacterium]